METRQGTQPGFLLAQIGGHAAAKFAERLAPLKLTPADAGILRFVRNSPGISQQELSTRLGIHPSRLVAILDVLEESRFVERRANVDDRRQYSLHITGEGEEVLQRIGKVAREHQEALLAALSAQERTLLTELLQKIAEEQRLQPGIHPGYKWMKPGRRPQTS
ncbi:MAG TPA: MarR family transcriptional regulator [Candidatus Angelobacter sp.]|nr:MarR family transcriptional regulator [Candidatus Angelobacter sp.]